MSDVMKDLKARAWTIVVYPDSAPENWLELVEELAIPCAISPLHDKDVNATGEPKKAHYHVILRWENTTTFSNVKHIADMLNAPIPKKVESIVGMYRYLTHEDNPDKAQYNSSDVKTMSGFDLHIFETMRTGEIERVVQEVEDIIDENNITEYYSLIKFLKAQNKHKHAYVVRGKTLYFTSYINSRRHNKENELKKREQIVYDKFQQFLEYGVVDDETIKGITDLFGSVKILD